MDKNKVKGHLAILGANLIWGLMSPVTKFIVKSSDVSALALASFRMSGAMILFWCASFLIPRERVEAKDKRTMFIAALFGIVLNQALFTTGIGFTSPANASIIASTTPIITMVIAAFYLKDRITRIKVLGLLASASGALILLSGSLRDTAGQHSNLAGDLMCLISQGCVSIYFVFFKGIIQKYSPITLMKWMFTFATICTLPFTYGQVAVIDYAALPSSCYWGIAYVVVISTFLTYLLLPIAQRQLKPTVVCMYNYVQPIVSSCVAIWWGMDVFGPMKFLSVILIFGGVYIVTQSNLKYGKQWKKKS